MKKALVTVITAISLLTSSAQDVHFSQFMQTPMEINPALTGMIPANIRANLAYRSQWASVTTPFKTFLFSADGKFGLTDVVSLGVGVNFYRDVAGDTRFGTTKAQLAVSSIVQVDPNNELSVGITGGILQKGMNPTDLQWDSQYQGGTFNSAFSSNETIDLRPGIMPDFSAGIAYSYHSGEGYMTANDQFVFRTGVSYNHINRPKMRFFDADTLYSNVIAFADATIGISNSRWSVVPSFLGMFQGPARELTFGALAKFRLQEASKITGLIKGAFLYGGAYYRLRDAVAAVLMLEFDRYMMGFSYDINVSPLAVASNLRGGFEVTFRFMTPNPYLYKGTRASFR